MKTMLLIVAWCLLFVLCWTLALAALFLPARVLGYRPAGWVEAHKGAALRCTE